MGVSGLTASCKQKMRASIRNTAIATCGVALLVSCQTVPEASRAEIDSARQAVEKCAFRQAYLFDDGKSNVEAAASYVVHSCKSEFINLRNVLVMGKSDNFSYHFDSMYPQGKHEKAIEAVWEARKLKMEENRLARKWPKAFEIGKISQRAISCGEHKQPTIATSTKLLFKAHPDVPIPSNANDVIHPLAIELLKTIKIGSDTAKNGEMVSCDQALADWRKLNAQPPVSGPR